MEIELVNCDCCGLREDCTEDYINTVKANFEGKWFCGLCSEAVRYELSRERRKDHGMGEAIKDHVSFCRKTKSSPAGRVADGMRQMLRRRSGDSPSAPKKFSRVGDEASLSIF